MRSHGKIFDAPPPALYTSRSLSLSLNHNLCCLSPYLLVCVCAYAACCPLVCFGGSYHKKKYTWKLVYIFVLGYDVDFGHLEAISLMLSQKYTEKVVGYAAVALMVHPLEVGE